MPNVTEEEAKKFWEICVQYLEDKTDIKAVHELATIEEHSPINDMEGFYKRLLESLRNRQGMPNSIGDIEELRTVLYEFNPQTIRTEYQNAWEKLFYSISKVNPHIIMEYGRKKHWWVVFSKGAIDGARFLSQFKSANDFREQVDSFAKNKIFMAGLPSALSLEIHGFGFPLACDFLKEAGWSQYAKPDVHTKQILMNVGFSNGKDYDTFQAIQIIAEYIGKTPYFVDKHIWLIGSTKTANGMGFKTRREEFLEFYWGHSDNQ